MQIFSHIYQSSYFFAIILGANPAPYNTASSTTPAPRNPVSSTASAPRNPASYTASAPRNPGSSTIEAAVVAAGGMDKVMLR